MIDNPWMRLPVTSPFVLAEDAEAIRLFNADAKPDHRVIIDKLLPEPFIGDPEAPILMLSNNPGFDPESDKNSDLRQRSEYMRLMRESLCYRFSEYPFVYLNPAFDEIEHWWRQKLRTLLAKFGHKVVARSVCNIVYFPYCSRRFAHGKCELSSQQYGFELVRAAVERGAIVVLMRKGQKRLWQEKVKGLAGYDNMVILRNPQMPAISSRNCEPGDYEKIVAAIEGSDAAKSVRDRFGN